MSCISAIFLILNKSVGDWKYLSPRKKFVKPVLFPIQIIDYMVHRPYSCRIKTHRISCLKNIQILLSTFIGRGL